MPILKKLRAGVKSKNVNKLFLGDKSRNLGFYSNFKTTCQNHILQKVTLKVYLSVTKIYKKYFIYLNKLKINLYLIIFLSLLFVTIVTLGNNQ